MEQTLQTIKFSTLDLDFVKHYLRIDFNDDDIELQLYLDSSKLWLLNYTGKTVEELDAKQYSVLVVLMMVAQSYEQKEMVTMGVNLKGNPLFEMLLKSLRTYKIGGIK